MTCHWRYTARNGGGIHAVCRPDRMERRIDHHMSMRRNPVRFTEINNLVWRRTAIFRELRFVLGRHRADGFPELRAISRSCTIAHSAFLRLHCLPIERQWSRIPEIRECRLVDGVPVVATELVKVEYVRTELESVGALFDLYLHTVRRGHFEPSIRLTIPLYTLIDLCLHPAAGSIASYLCSIFSD